MPLITASTIENITVLIKLPVANHATNLSTSITINTVIRKEISHNVKKFKGAVRARSILPITAFITHRSNATMKAVVSHQDKNTFGTT